MTMMVTVECAGASQGFILADLHGNLFSVVINAFV